MIQILKAKDINLDLKIKINSESKLTNNAIGDIWLYNRLIIREVNYHIKLDSLEPKVHLLNNNNIKKY